MHDLTTRQPLFKASQGHKGKVTGLTFADLNGDRLLTCGMDRTVKMWRVAGQDGEDTGEGTSSAPISVFPGKFAFKYVVYFQIHRN